MTTVVLLAGASIGAEPVNDSFEAAEAANQSRQAEMLCAFMALDTMFPNPQHRALAQAAARGDAASLEAILDAGVSAAARGRRGCTVLFWSLGRSVDGFRALLERGANPNAVFDDGGSVMHWSTSWDDQSMQVSLYLLVKVDSAL